MSPMLHRTGKLSSFLSISVYLTELEVKLLRLTVLVPTYNLELCMLHLSSSLPAHWFSFPYGLSYWRGYPCTLCHTRLVKHTSLHFIFLPHLLIWKYREHSDVGASSSCFPFSFSFSCQISKYLITLMILPMRILLGGAMIISLHYKSIRCPIRLMSLCPSRKWSLEPHVWCCFTMFP